MKDKIITQKKFYSIDLTEQVRVILHNILSCINEYHYNRMQLIINDNTQEQLEAEEFIDKAIDRNISLYKNMKQLVNNIKKTNAKYLQKEKGSPTDADFRETVVTFSLKKAIKSFQEIVNKSEICTSILNSSIKIKDELIGELSKNKCHLSEVDLIKTIYVWLICVLTAVHEFDKKIVFNSSHKINTLITSENERSPLCRKLLWDILSCFETYFYANSDFLYGQQEHVSENHTEIFIDFLLQLYASIRPQFENIKHIFMHDNSIPPMVKSLPIETIPSDSDHDLLQYFEGLRANERKENHLFYSNESAFELMRLISSVFIMSYDYKHSEDIN